ncbi:hypothetical protein AVEN_242113-1 [Araneus ventricosus]|uniref:Uncharacterized protein n=1 Tax=Araneus ventricosus TaxID=182803 RepID=A0A4Y2PN54_ARAVE|nr:hypothetical protein AVEN_242113-1 [Araneus ventricosus]
MKIQAQEGGENRETFLFVHVSRTPSSKQASVPVQAGINLPDESVKGVMHVREIHFFFRGRVQGFLRPLVVRRPVGRRGIGAPAEENAVIYVTGKLVQCRHQILQCLQVLRAAHAKETIKRRN